MESNTSPLQHLVKEFNGGSIRLKSKRMLEFIQEEAPQEFEALDTLMKDPVYTATSIHDALKVLLTDKDKAHLLISRRTLGDLRSNFISSGKELNEFVKSIK